MVRRRERRRRERVRVCEGIEKAMVGCMEVGALFNRFLF